MFDASSVDEPVRKDLLLRGFDRFPGLGALREQPALSHPFLMPV